MRIECRRHYSRSRNLPPNLLLKREYQNRLTGNCEQWVHEAFSDRLDGLLVRWEDHYGIRN